MDENKSFEYGGKIFDNVTKAVNSGDFSNLSRDIKNVVSAGIGTVLINHAMRKKESMTPFFCKKIKKGKGKGKIVGGSIMATLGLFTILGSENNYKGIWFEIILIGIGVLLIFIGIQRRRLIKDYFRFGEIIGKRPFITINELSDRYGKSPDYVIHQIDRMKQADYLPYATMDRDKTTLMLTDEVYKEYLKVSMNGEGMPDSAADRSLPEEEDTPMFEELKIDKKLPEEVKTILREGNEYLKKIRYFNDLIPDTESMSDKLYDLEKTSLSIFKKVKEEPDLARKNQLRRLMSYYLPSSEKLLQSYVNMRDSTQNVENIEKSKRDIEEATDALNKAFLELLNQLFESTTSDISADISVMKTWMQQDALME